MKKICIFILLFISFPAFSGNIWDSQNKISKIWVLSDGNFAIYTSSVVNSVCQSEGELLHVYLNQNSVSASGVKNLLSTALLAMSADMNVEIKYDNSSSSCFLNELRLKK